MFVFRDFKDSDAQIVLGWIDNEKSFRQWSADKYKTYPAKAEDVNTFYGTIKTNGAMPLMFCDGDVPVGHLIVRPLSDIPVKTVRFGFIIVDNAQRGKGYGKAMLTQAIKFACDKFGAEKITLGVFENNQKARKCYESVGFKVTDDAEIYAIGDEEWTCLEMEYVLNMD